MPNKPALAPLVADDPVSEAPEEVLSAPKLAPAIDPADLRAHQNKLSRTKAALAAQPRVRIRLPEDTTVQINGYGFYIAGKTTVDVPQGVFDVLEQAGRI